MARTATTNRARLRPPLFLVVLAALGLAVFVIPLVGLVLETPWTELVGLLTTSTALDALRLSLLASIAALRSASSASTARGTIWASSRAR